MKEVSKCCCSNGSVGLLTIQVTIIIWLLWMESQSQLTGQSARPPLLPLFRSPPIMFTVMSGQRSDSFLILAVVSSSPHPMVFGINNNMNFHSLSCMCLCNPPPSHFIITLRHYTEPQGVKLKSSDFEAKSVQLEISNHPTDHTSEVDGVQKLQKFIEEQTGLLTVVRGLGQLSSAVSELRPPTRYADQSDSNDKPHDGVRWPLLFGVVRLSQLQNGSCFVDGLIDQGTRSSIQADDSNRQKGIHHRLRHYSLAIHEFGDLSSDNFDSIGEPLIKLTEPASDDEGFPSTDRSAADFNPISLRKIVPNCDVSAMIGRSIALSEISSTSNEKEREIVSAGVIARASTVDLNKKQVCSCSGRTIWEERVEIKRHEWT